MLTNFLQQQLFTPRGARWAMASLALSASACGTLGEHQAHRSSVVPGTSRSGFARAQSASPEGDPRFRAASAYQPIGRPAAFGPPANQPLPAEVRIQLGANGECPHGCPPGEDCPSCPTGCCDTDRYPDEYLCDGGDRELPVHYQEEEMLGLETQDTVAEFRDGERRRRVRHSNEVCIYAPRFSSVTVFSGVVEDTLQLKPSQNQIEQKQVSVHLPNPPVVALQNESPERMFSKVRGTTILNADVAFDVNQQLGAVELDNDLVPVTYFSYLQAVISRQVQEALTATQVQNAVVWTRVQSPVIVAKDDAVQLVECRFNVEELAGSDVRGPGNLKIVKLADVKIAAQGDEITFTIRYQNRGDSPVTEVTIIDNLTPRLEYVEASQTNDRPSQFAAVDNGEGSVILRWELDEPLPGRTTGIITFKARVR